MNSLFAQLFLALQAHIKTNVPDIRWIDQDLGQLEYYETRPPVSFPCVLIDFTQTSFDQMTGNRQQASLNITVRLGFDSFSSSASTAPDSVRQKALEYYEIEQKLYEAVQGFDAGGLMQECTRINSATERRDGDNFRVRVMTFTSITEDSSACPKTRKLKAKLSVEVDEGDGVGSVAIGQDLEVS